jgi:hypothetical protein
LLKYFSAVKKLHYLSLGLHDRKCGSGSTTLLKTGPIWEQEKVGKRIENGKRGSSQKRRIMLKI